MNPAARSCIHSVVALAALLERWRGSGERVVFTNGCFDLLHAGHVLCLEAARGFGDRLVVGVNSDRSVQVLKGTARPIVPAADRALLVAALAVVDAVTVFDEDTPIELIRVIRPDVLVKGQDHREDTLAGAAEVRSWGGRVELIPVALGRSTTAIISRIRAQASAAPLAIASPRASGPRSAP